MAEIRQWSNQNKNLSAPLFIYCLFVRLKEREHKQGFSGHWCSRLLVMA